MPPFEMPPARTLLVPGRGELFLRDTGGDGPPVMLLHGWMASADLNWCGGLRRISTTPATACWPSTTAATAAGCARWHRSGWPTARPTPPRRCGRSDVAPAIVVGYSMGGAIAQLVARDHPDVAGGVVLSGTAQHWQDPSAPAGVQGDGRARPGAVGGAPRHAGLRASRRAGMPRVTERTAWLQSELMRHSARDIAEAGRELGRFDSRPWLGSIAIRRSPSWSRRATSAVPAPRKQRELAAARRARSVFEAPIRHLEIVTRAHEYNPALLRALAAVGGREGAAVA